MPQAPWIYWVREGKIYTGPKSKCFSCGEALVENKMFANFGEIPVGEYVEKEPQKVFGYSKDKKELCGHCFAEVGAMDQKEVSDRASRLWSVIHGAPTSVALDEISREINRVAQECGWQKERLAQIDEALRTFDRTLNPDIIKGLLQ